MLGAMQLSSHDLYLEGMADLTDNLEQKIVTITEPLNDLLSDMQEFVAASKVEIKALTYELKNIHDFDILPNDLQQQVRDVALTKSKEITGLVKQLTSMSDTLSKEVI